MDTARLPDRTTIWHFENRIGVAGAEALFAAVEQQILQHVYVARGGQIIDAIWTKKHGKSTHGFKLSISVDHKHKLIRKLVTDTASVHDSQHFEVVLDDWNTSAEVYADRGYPSQARVDFALTMMAVPYNLRRLVFPEEVRSGR